MAIQSEECPLPRRVSAHSLRISLTARRVIVAVIGGVLAFGAGTGMAFAFRVSPDVTAVDAPDPTVADELPSQAAARAYAMNNPPAYLSPPTATVETGAATAIDDQAAVPGADHDAAETTDATDLSSHIADQATASDDDVTSSAADAGDGSPRTGSAEPGR